MNQPVTLGLALMLSLAANVWQFRHAGELSARTEATVDRVADANDAAAKTIDFQGAQLAKCVADTLFDRVAAAAASADRARELTEISERYAAKRNRQAIEFATTCKAWAEAPTCVAE
jgi:hypothetical protein